MLTSCCLQNVLKGAIGACIAEGITDLSKIKSKTKAGAGKQFIHMVLDMWPTIISIGCGGCVPLVTSIYKAAMQKAGHATNNKSVFCPELKVPSLITMC